MSTKLLGAGAQTRSCDAVEVRDLRGSFPPLKVSKTESPFLLGHVGRVVASSRTP
jgi:hypothetical protein